MKVIDFGFSTEIKNKDDFLNVALGTPLYMAPEVHERNYKGIEADLFSLGVLLFVLVT